MIKLMLDTHKFNNYAFFCPVSKLHLTVSSPVGFTNGADFQWIAYLLKMGHLKSGECEQFKACRAR